jgi:membrane associated rhomboid family serine protease
MWNMVGLYFFCGPLERLWSGRKFLLFYLACGVGGGLGFVLLTSILFAFGYDSALLIPLLGASGGILGCLMACAILFPEMLFLIFPIRWVTAFIFALYLLTVIFEKHLGNACHLGGMITAAVWVWGVPKIRQSSGMRRPRRVRGPWQHKLDQRDRDREEVDRILQKVHEQGIQSLTGKERKKLQQETDKYKKRNSDLP